MATSNYRSLIAQLAKNPNLGQRETATRIAAEARRIDPQGQFEVQDSTLTVNGLPRRVSVVVNRSPDAGRVEFGRVSGREGSDGRGGLRPLGRAARSEEV